MTDQCIAPINDAKFAVEVDGERYTHPRWVGAANNPFQSVEDARDWGDEIICQLGVTEFRIVGIDSNYSELRYWVQVDNWVEESRSIVESEDQADE